MSNKENWGRCVWYAKGKSPASIVLSVGIVILILAIAMVLLDKVRIADIAFAILTGVFLFKK